MLEWMEARKGLKSGPPLSCPNGSTQIASGQRIVLRERARAVVCSELRDTHRYILAEVTLPFTHYFSLHTPTLLRACVYLNITWLEEGLTWLGGCLVKTRGGRGEGEFIATLAALWFPLLISLSLLAPSPHLCSLFPIVLSTTFTSPSHSLTECIEFLLRMALKADILISLALTSH